MSPAKHPLFEMTFPGGGRIERRFYGEDAPHGDLGADSWGPIVERAKREHTAGRATQAGASALLAQVRLNQELHLVAALTDDFAVELLGELTIQRSTLLEALTRRVGSAADWISIGKLMRAELVEEVDDEIVVTSRGTREFDRWLGETQP